MAPKTPGMQSRIDPTERSWVNGTKWGDLKASTLSGVMQRAEMGDVADWADLCEFAIRTTDSLTSLYETRLLRVTQAQYEIAAPDDSWNPVLARMAADFINEQVRRIADFKRSLKELLHAIAVGYSASECIYDRDNQRRVNYVSRIQFVHPHRFRYDEQRNLRLYDRGRRSSPGSAYGEMLDPRRWIVHEHNAVAGYAGASGVMAACIWRWMFARWVDRFWILHQEKYGSPIAYAKVNPNTPDAVRAQILEDLQNLSNEHVGVFEGHEVSLLEAAVTNPEGFKQYVQFTNEMHTKAWLGATDLTDPGSHGSQSAVGTRASLTADPRMIADAESLSETLRKSLFRGLIEYNLHKFPPGTQLSDVPMPVLRLASESKTQDSEPAAQEVGQGMGDKAVAPVAEPLQGAQLDALKNIIADVAAGLLPRSSAVALAQLAVPSAPADLIERMIPTQSAQPAAAEEPQSDPKAPAPVAPGQASRAPRTSSVRASTRRISSRSVSQFAKTLRRA